MGSNGSKLGAFQSDVFATGLDLRRCEINRDLGMWKAADAASFEQGMLLSLNADGELVLADGADVLGVAKHNKVLLQKGIILDELVTVVANGVTQLARGNVSNVAVRAASGLTGTPITAAGDYTLSAANGTLTWDAVPTEVSDAQDVYVSYSFDMTQADYRFQGRNFFNGIDDASPAEGRMTVILGPALIFTTQYDPSVAYALTGAGSKLYCGGSTSGKEGLFTSASSEGVYVGRCVQLPSADDPFMGIMLTGHSEE